MTADRPEGGAETGVRRGSGRAVAHRPPREAGVGAGGGGTCEQSCPPLTPLSSRSRSRPRPAQSGNEQVPSLSDGPDEAASPTPGAQGLLAGQRALRRVGSIQRSSLSDADQGRQCEVTDRDS